MPSFHRCIRRLQSQTPMRRNEECRLGDGRLKIGDDRSENRYHNDRQSQNDHQAIQERP